VRVILFVAIGLTLIVFLTCHAGSLMSRRYETVLRAEKPSDPETRFVDTRSGRVHVLDVGTGEEVILLLHGTGRSVADWQEGLADELARTNRVVGVDYYGLGMSDRSHGWRYGIDLWAEQAVDVLDALAIDSVTVVGHSAGGAVAAILTDDHPERIDRAVFIGHGMAMDPMQIVPILPGIGDIAMARTPIFSDTFSAEHQRRLSAAYAIRGTRTALLTFLRRQYTIDGLRLVTGTYETLERPVLQIHGAEDASISISAARDLSERIEDGRFLTLPEIGHDVHIEAPAELAEAIRTFIRVSPTAR
jgi:2-hydroxymuconate-semialdehyde hydrolase